MVKLSHFLQFIKYIDSEKSFVEISFNLVPVLYISKYENLHYLALQPMGRCIN